jgi:hypothetical protein
MRRNSPASIIVPVIVLAYVGSVIGWLGTHIQQRLVVPLGFSDNSDFGRDAPEESSNEEEEKEDEKKEEYHGDTISNDGAADDGNDGNIDPDVDFTRIYSIPEDVQLQDNVFSYIHHKIIGLIWSNHRN